MGIYYDSKREPGKRWVVSYEKTDYTPEELRSDRPTDLRRNARYTVEVCDGPVVFGNDWCWYKKREWRDNWVDDTNANNINRQLNADGVANQKTLRINEAKNKAYDNTIAVASTTQGGDYVNQRESIRQFLNAKALLPENLPTEIGRAHV